MSIHEIHIGLPGLDDVKYEPPDRVVNVAVAGEHAFLQVQPCDEKGRLGDIESEIRVPAKSLVRALQTLIEDQEAED